MVQTPRIPIWVVGAWPRRTSMQRALRYDGLLPHTMGGDLIPDDLRAITAYVAAQRPAPTPFDIVCGGRTPGDDKEQAVALVRRWQDAGATWWIEEMWEEPHGLDAVAKRIRQGPPRSA